MFAIGIDGLDLNQGPKYFQLTMQKRNYSIQDRIRKTIPLQKCKREQWSKISSKFGETYDRLEFSRWLCPPEDILIQLQGKFTSEIFQYQKIAVAKCKPSNSTRGCVNNTAINAYLYTEQAFNFNFYFVNSLLNPGTQQVISYYLQDIPFSPTSVVNANLFIETFKIQTDQSIFPFENVSKVRGGVIRNKASFFSYDVQQDEYLRFYLRKSSISLKINRSFRKADDTVSYSGGLFSAILTILVL